MRGVLFLLLLASSCALAVPAPPQIIVSHSLKQCADYVAGDECMHCPPPQGWQVLPYGNDSCPAGYTKVSASYNCTSSRNQFCCSEGHSGAPGECSDMLVRDATKECGFVENASTCNPPKGWGKRPAWAPASSWECPDGYSWVNVTCLSYGTGANGSGGSSGCGSAALLLMLPMAALLTKR